MNAIINNIKNGDMFPKKERFENELLIDFHKPINYASFTTTPIRSSIAIYFNKALGAYKQAHRLN